MRGKQRRIWEGGKTLLIVLLTCSAVYLAGRTLFPQETAGFLSRLPQAASTSSQHSDSFSDQTLRPAAFAVTWEEGRYGLLYHQEDQESYTQVSALLAEALSDAGGPSQVTRRDWLQALSAPGVFWEYLGPIPLDALTRWLSNQDNSALGGFSAQRLCTTATHLYFETEDEVYYACPLKPDLTTALNTLFPLFSPNGARFAVEDSQYSRLRSDALVLPGTPSLPQLTGENPVAFSDSGEPGEVLSQMLQALSFHPQTNPLYTIPGGWAITDGGETLRISSSGQLTYRRSDDANVRFPVQDLADATRALAEKTVGSVGGAGRLYLRQIRREGSATVVTYGYAYRGAAIQTGDEGWCAQFIIENGAVSAFVLEPRRYATVENSVSLLLPQEQAAAALPEGTEQALELLYDDTGSHELMSPFWAVRSLGR